MAAKHLQIVTPRGIIYIGKGGKAELKWFLGFGQKWTKRYVNAQEYLDATVVNGCSKYIPLKTGMLDMSGKLGTRIGSGLVQWIALYAKAQYYLKNRKQKLTGGIRGSRWLDRWKAVYGQWVIAKVKTIVGRGTK